MALAWKTLACASFIKSCTISNYTITSSRRVLAGRGRRPAGGGTLELLVPCQGSRLTSVPRGLVLVDTGVAGTLVWLVSVFRGVATPLRLCEWKQTWAKKRNNGGKSDVDWGKRISQIPSDFRGKMPILSCRSSWPFRSHTVFANSLFSDWWMRGENYEWSAISVLNHPHEKGE